eukprot:gnl/TRDRNA2_/TRDRNA2_141803_c0_seq1.p1 gnl/TRDRNA2_/TRDRNA2_141803_c0~~gnl/TRDRNA2_/TRDRNA2_141803_c0_seq1.p1  ORF type:complete len:197 (+),score=39.51 gnl/TRDRNA2_/TRDRNA2_141803_c0_seq1:88-591(+)
MAATEVSPTPNSSLQPPPPTRPPPWPPKREEDAQAQRLDTDADANGTERMLPKLSQPPPLLSMSAASAARALLNRTPLPAQSFGRAEELHTGCDGSLARLDATPERYEQEGCWAICNLCFALCGRDAPGGESAAVFVHCSRCGFDLCACCASIPVEAKESSAAMRWQ